MIINLGINYSFNNFSGIISFLLEYFSDNIHNFTNHGWESLENFLDDTTCDLLKHTVCVLDELESWLFKLLELWTNEINENIYR